MKKTRHYIILAASMLALGYLVGAFGSASFNIAEWSEKARWMVASITAFVTMFIVGAIASYPD